MNFVFVGNGLPPHTHQAKTMNNPQNDKNELRYYKKHKISI